MKIFSLSHLIELAAQLPAPGQASTAEQATPPSFVCRSLPSSEERSDSDIAQAALSRWAWNYVVPGSQKVKVSKGWATFESEVQAAYQRDEADVLPEKPHGLDYSLTLHGPHGERLVIFANARPVAERVP